MAWKKVSPALMLALLYPACVGDNETSPTEVCAAGEVWTVGTVTIPCFIAVLAACAVYGGTGTACGLLCAQK
jgi:hypothetical protein